MVSLHATLTGFFIQDEEILVKYDEGLALGVIDSTVTWVHIHKPFAV